MSRKGVYEGSDGFHLDCNPGLCRPVSRAWVLVTTGLRLAVHIQPGAKQSAVEGIVEDADGRAMLKVRIQAPPVDGAANAALIAYLAAQLGVRKRDIVITHGLTARHKRLEIAGEGAALAARLTALADAAQ